MLKQRIIPILLLDGNGLVKTIKFSEPNYIGDPINTVKLFNDKDVHELFVIDISRDINKKPNFDLLSELASEAFIPMGYGGGIKTLNK